MRQKGKLQCGADATRRRLSVVLGAFVTVAALAPIEVPSAAAGAPPGPPPPSPPSGWSNLEQTDSIQGGFIDAVATTGLGGRRLVTAVRDGKGRLKVILWELQLDGSVKRLSGQEGEIIPQRVTAIASLQHHPDAPLGRDRFVTVVRLSTKRLKLTLWTATQDGEILRRASRKTEMVEGEFAVATFKNNLVITAFRNAQDKLKLISWRVGGDGSLEPLNGAVGEDAVQIALATYDAFPPDTGRLASVVTGSDGKLKITSWSVDDSGTFKPLGDVEGPVLEDVAATSLSHRRIATAGRTANNRLDVRSWGFDPAGKPVLHSNASAGEIGEMNVGIASLNATRLVTAVRDASGRLALLSWDAVDGLVRLGTLRDKSIDRLSIASLGSDWIAAAVRTESNALKVIAHREHAVSLLKGEWTPADTTPTPIWSPSDIRFEPKIEGIDPHIAVGHNFLMISQEGSLAFFDKTGNRLGPVVNLDDFFSTFTTAALPDGSRNEHNIQRHLGFPPKGALHRFIPGAEYLCDPDAAVFAPPCLRDFTDTRVHYDASHKRFVVAAFARPPKCVYSLTNFDSGSSGCTKGTPQYATDCKANPLFRRYWAFAVSKDEDPRLGFHQWMSTESSCTYDFPRVSTSPGVFVAGNDVSEGSAWIPLVGVKPLLFTFSMDDLITGSPYPRSHKIYPADLYGDGLKDKNYAAPRVLAHYGETSNRTFLAQAKNAGFDIYSFVQPTADGWKSFPKIDKTHADMPAHPSNPIEVGNSNYIGAFRDGRVYVSWNKDGTNKGGILERSVRVARITLESLSGTPTAQSPAFYQLVGSTDATSECSALSVTKDGHAVIVYGSLDYTALRAEARYRVLYGDERGLGATQVLQSGEYARASPKNYCSLLDYQTADIDPADQGVAWIISEYADAADIAGGKNVMRTVVGKVTP